MKLNLANRITLTRVIMVPIFMTVLLVKAIPYNRDIAAAIFVIAAITDSIDGYIARSRNQVTNFGKFMDPIADKLLVVAALLCLVEMNTIVKSWIAMIIISREFIVSGVRLVAAAEGVVIAASKLGKLKTITQVVAIVVILIKNFPFSIVNIPFDVLTLWVALILTVVSGVEYIVRNIDVLNMNK